MMTGNQLKNTILQEAIEGRLVPQDPNDEPASVLLDKIRKEKAKLVKEGKLKKKDLEETPVDEDEIPFLLPNNWEWTTISNIFIINPKVIAEDSQNAAFIPMEKIEAGYSSNYTFEVKKWGEIKKSFTNFADGDVAFAKITPCFQNRKSVIFQGLPNGIGAGTTELKVLRPIGNTIDRRYLLYFLKSQYFISEAKFKGTANQQRIVVGYLENKYFPLPPLAEQHRIVAKIEELLPKVEEYGKAQESLDKLNEGLLERLKKSILQEAIEGRLVPQDPNDEPASALLEKIKAEKKRLVKEKKIILGKPEKKVHQNEIEDLTLPQSWVWCQINDICRTFGRIGFRGYTKDDLRNNPKDGAITLSPSNIVNDKLDLSSCTYLSWDKYYESPEIVVSKGDIILVKTASIGKCALVEEVKHEMTVNPQFVVIKDIRIFNKYLFYLLLSPYVQDKIRNYAIGTSIPTYSQVSLISMKVPLPPLAEQKRIVAKVEKLLHEIDKLKI